MPGLLFRYMLLQCVSAFALVAGLFAIAILLVDVVEQLRTVGQDVDLSLLSAVRLSLFKLPGIIEQTLPFAVLIAAIVAYNRLNKRSELSVVRASGLSAWRFLLPIFVLSLGLGLLSAFFVNPLGAHLTSEFESERTRILTEGGDTLIKDPHRNVWLRQGDGESQIVVHADEVDPEGLTFLNVQMIEEIQLYEDGAPSGLYRFARRIDAPRAELRDGFWQLYDAVENQPGRPPVLHSRFALPTDIDAARLLDRFASPSTVGVWDLPGFIDQTRAAGLDASAYVMRLHSLAALPALFVAMGLIGALVCLRFSRLGGTSQLVAAGVVIAVVVFFITQLSASLGASGAAPPVVAAWAPALAALFATAGFVAFKEDG